MKGKERRGGGERRGEERRGRGKEGKERREEERHGFLSPALHTLCEYSPVLCVGRDPYFVISAFYTQTSSKHCERNRIVASLSTSKSGIYPSNRMQALYQPTSHTEEPDSTEMRHSLVLPATFHNLKS